MLPAKPWWIGCLPCRSSAGGSQYCPDDIYRIRAVVSAWIADPAVQITLITGGTGMTGRDSTPEAIRPFARQGNGRIHEIVPDVLSWEEIGTSTLQSRALGGLANATFIFCSPGSTGSAKAPAGIAFCNRNPDARTRPCNLVELLPRLRER